MLHRRQALIGLIAATAAPRTLFAADTTDAPQRSSLGLVAYCCASQRQVQLRPGGVGDLFDPLTFLDHCHALGAGGMQVNLGVRPRRDCEVLRERADHAGMFIEAIVRVPEDEEDVDRFSSEIETAATCGALAARTTILPGRRYEFFATLDSYREYVQHGLRALERAAPVVEHYELPLAVENHKDQRCDERVRLFEHLDSPFIGACVDTGNSVALLEPPLDTVRA